MVRMWRPQGGGNLPALDRAAARPALGPPLAGSARSVMDTETRDGSFIICLLAKTDLEWDIGHRRVEVLDECGVI